MSIPGLTIIGESINDSVPPTHELFLANDMDGIVEVARFQAEKGARYIDVNVGLNTPGFMADTVKAIQKHISLPLSIDTPDPAIAQAGLEAYDAARAGNQIPILNSISESRLEMFNVYAKQPFKPILLITEGLDEKGSMVMNETAPATYATARSMVAQARERAPGIANEDIILDPGISPIGSDAKGDFKRLIESMRLIHGDADLKGIDMSVGLSNFSVMLPPKTPSGQFVRSSLESAFLTLAMPLGLHTVIGSVRRNYNLLEDDHPALQCLTDILELEGMDALIRLMAYYS